MKKRYNRLSLMGMALLLYLALGWLVSHKREQRAESARAIGFASAPPPCPDAPPEGGYEYGFCALTRVRNVAFMIPQWIEYHRIAGVDMFFISDDCSTDDHLGARSTRQILKKYAALGIIQYVRIRRNLLSKAACAMHKPDEDSHFRMLFGAARLRCKYIGVWDVDEYVTSTNMTFFGNLSAFMESAPACFYCGTPFYKRIPWFVMGSEGLEANPDKRLLIENHQRGALYLNHIKTFAESRAVDTWQFSLWPHFTERFMDHYDIDITQVESVNLLPGEFHAGMDDNGRRCKVPASPVFLKHYIYMSWTEFQAGRGSTKRTSNNDVSPWAANPRTKWLEGGNVTEFAYQYGQTYTMKMIPLTLAALNKTWFGEL